MAHASWRDFALEYDDDDVIDVDEDDENVGVESENTRQRIEVPKFEEVK